MRVMGTVPASLRLSREHLQAALDAISDAVLTVNRDFVVTSFNRAAEAVTGLARTDVIGRPCYEVLQNTICDHVAICPMAQLFDGRAGGHTQEVPAHPPANEAELEAAPRATLRITVHALHDNGAVVGGIEVFRPYTPGEWLGWSAGESGQGPRDFLILQETERRMLEEALRRHHGNRVEACRELGLSRSTLWRKMQRLGISRARPRRKRT